MNKGTVIYGDGDKKVRRNGLFTSVTAATKLLGFSYNGFKMAEKSSLRA